MFKRQGQSRDLQADSGAVGAGARHPLSWRVVRVLSPALLMGSLAATFLGVGVASAAPPPTVTSVSPNSGSTAGGTGITIGGTGFTNTATVAVGANACTSVVFVSSISLTCTTPAGSAGTVDVRVTVSPHTSAINANDQFTYVGPPTVTAVTPSNGPIAGGTGITITGTSFLNATAVHVGTGVCTSVVVVTNTSITCNTPSGSVGTVDVTVTTPLGTSPANPPGDQFSYLPTVTSVAPAFGPTTGGTSITITGSGFTGATAADVGGTACTDSFTVVNDTSITCNTPSGSAGTVDVTVITPGGTSVANPPADDFTYEGVPTVTSVSPAFGPTTGGTPITITGTSFLSETAVQVGATPCISVVTVSDTSITCTTQAGSGTVDVTVTNPQGTSATSPADDFTFEGAPTVTAVAPNNGPTGSGTSITITGTNFLSATAVSVGANACTGGLPALSDTSITCTAPAASAGTVDVTVTNPQGTSAPSANDEFTYEDAPTVTNVNPNSGPTDGGTGITITGTGFIGATAVSLNASACTSVTVVSSTSITCTTPAGSAGIVDVQVGTPQGTSAVNAPADQFTYVVLPTVTSVLPTNGAEGSSTPIIITGTHFSDAAAASVTVGDQTCGTFVLVNNTTITCIVPPSDLGGTGAGTVDVIVHSPAGPSPTNPGDEFSYEATPTVTAVSPNGGPLAGGTTITITGTSFLSEVAVTVGTNPCGSVNVVSDTSITCITPAGIALGTVEVTVTNTTGPSPANPPNDNFTYEDVPTVTAVSPTFGPVAGGTGITITGTNFTGATSANVCPSVTVVNSTTINCTTAAGSAGPIDVTVTTPSGTSVANPPNDQFTYEGVPTVTAVAPNSGLPAGGTSITVSGTGFLSETVVNVGALACTNVGNVTDTSLTCDTPAGSAGTVEVTVTNPQGTSPLNAPNDNFTYEGGPTVTGVSPAFGPAAGGTPITITGTNFFGATSSNVCPSLTSVSNTTITCTTAAGSGTVDVTVTTPSGTSGANPPGDQFTYEGVPTVSAVAPNNGPVAGSTGITITGTGFLSETGVSVGANVCTGITVVDDTSITCTTPASTLAGSGAGTVDVTVTNPQGTSTTNAGDHFIYEATPTVTAVAPASGPLAGGTTITITGTSFLSATAVSVGANACASFTVVTDTSITCTTPAGSAGTVDVTVTNSTGTSAVNSPADNFTYEGAPTVTGVSPSSGSTSGGTTLTITGTGFIGATAVKLGSPPHNNCGTIVVVSSTQLTCVTPSNHAAGTVDVQVTTGAGQSALNTPADNFTFVTGLPNVTAVTPNSGSTAGGTAISITGTGFTGATAVAVGANACTTVVVVSATHITCNTPAGSVGTVNVTVTTPGGTSPADPPADDFTYETTPTVTAVSPNFGPAAGGTSITITGTSFLGATVVDVGPNACTGLVVVSATTITCTTPAGSAGTVDVTVTTPAGTSAANPPGDQFIYQATPTVTAVSPTSGTTAGGTGITITGTDFLGATVVDVGPNACTSVAVVNATTITCTTPVGSVGAVDVTVTTGSGTSAPNPPGDQFTYVVLPNVTGVAPNFGPTTGTDITITGTGFTGATAVDIGANACNNVVVGSDSSITCTTPAGSPGTVDVTVTTGAGTSPTSSADDFTYDTTPTVTGVSPNFGPTGSGTAITITGTGFLSGPAVNVGAQACNSVSVVSDTSIHCNTPTSSAGTVDVTVVTTEGTSPTSAADNFSYDTTPTVTAVSPNSGSTAGGTGITITGTGFLSAPSVSVGANSCTSVAAVSDTTITCTTPAGSAGTVDVQVTTTEGTSTTSGADSFTYATPPPPPPTPTPPPPPAGAVSSANATSSSSSGTATATNAGTTVSGSGFGALTVSQYGSDPETTTPFGSSGEYFDVQVATGSSFTTVTITDCNLNGGTSIDWWNGSAFVPVTPQSAPAGTPPCITMTLSGTSSPTIAQLTGTVFAVVGLNAPTAPGAPTGLTATGGNASVTLSWTAPSSNGGSAITGYNVFEGTTSGGESSTPVNATLVSGTTFTVNGLTNGTAYFFTVKAVNSVGSSASSAEASATPSSGTTPPTAGYWEVASDGGIFSFGNAHFFGSTGSLVLNKPIVGMAATPDKGGYWLVASDGGIFSFGDAHFFGSTGSLKLNKPIVGMATTPDGGGYWLVASDGGIFSYGDAHFFGSTGSLKLNKPIVGLATTPDGGGYWLVASDGGIFAFGDAHFFGSTGSLTLNKPIVGMAATPDGGGYWLVASDGGIFSYGDAHFHGSTGSLTLNKPIVGMSVTPDGGGYRMVASDGGIFSFGDAAFFGSMGGTTLNKPIVGMATS